MPQKRVFIAINLPESVKKQIDAELLVLREKLPQGTRFVAREDWHITVSFLSQQSDESIGEIIGAMSSVMPRTAAPEIRFEDMVYGPEERSPRMVWIVASLKSSSLLGDIKHILEEELIQRKVRLGEGDRKFSGHITLARLNNFDTPPPPLENKVNFSFIPESLDLMESQPSHSGPRYHSLTAMDFQQ